MRFAMLAFFCLTVFSLFSQTIKFENVTVLTMGGSPKALVNHDVSIQEGIIVAIQAHPSGIKADVTVDGSGKFLMPGLIDCYTHIHEKSLVLEIASGVTTVVNAIGSPYQHRLKVMVDSGKLVGPRIFSVGSPLASPPAIYHTQGLLTTEEEARFAIRETKRMGYQAVFIYVNIEEGVYRAALDEAARVGLPVFGHTPYRVGGDFKINKFQVSHNNLVGLMNLETGETYDRKTLDSFAARFKQNGNYVIPTLTIHKARALAGRQDSLRMARALKYELPRQKAYWHLSETGYSYSGAKEIVQSFYQNGVHLLIGTDGGFHFVPHGAAYQLELKNFAELGIANRDILMAATTHAAQYLNMTNIGSVEVGKVADLILLDKNPLENIENIRLLNGVMARGKWFSKNALQDLLTLHEQEIKSSSAKRMSPFLPPKNGKRIASYEIIQNGVVAGEENIYEMKEKKGNRALISQNAIDPPLQRLTQTKWSLRPDGSLTSMHVDRTGTEGRASLTAVLDSVFSVTGKVPMYGDVAITRPVRSIQWVTAPSTSVNIDMDVVGTFHTLIPFLSDIAPGAIGKLTVAKVKLNSEEWGEKSIADTVLYIFTRLLDEGNNKKYKFSHAGFNGDSSITFMGAIEVNGNGIIESIQFNGRIEVRRKR